MKYLNLDDHHSEAECSNDAIKSSELLVNRLTELEQELQTATGVELHPAGSGGTQ